MANGLLGKALTTSGSFVLVYTAPSNVKMAFFSLNAVNLATSEATIQVAITASGTPAPTDFIEYDTVLVANGGVLERTCLKCSAGESVFVKASNSEIAVRVFGLEEV